MTGGSQRETGSGRIISIKVPLAWYSIGAQK